MKIIVIGLDGATFDLMMPWISEGILPYLGKLVMKGVKGNLQSTVPPFSAVAWSSYMTGKNPGKHGVFDFRYPRSVSKSRNFTSSRSLRSQSLWRILSDHGKRVGIVNVPMTYPPEEVNGFIIGNTLTATVNKDLFYPKNIYEEIQFIIKKYRLELNWESYNEGKIADLLRDISEMIRKKGDIALFCMENYPWDFFNVVFTEIDRIQHFIWRYVDENHSLYCKDMAQKYYQSIIEYYQLVDSYIGKMMEKADQDTSIFIMSDHGFGPLEKKIYLNKWLIDLGLLSLKNTPFSWRQFIRRIDFLNLRGKLPPNTKRKIRSMFDMDRFVDWENTRAYSGTPSEQGIYINVQGKEPDGIVEPEHEYARVRDFLAERLLDLVDPEDGNKIVEKIYYKEDLYSGPYVKFAPDIIIETKGMIYSFDNTLDGKYLLEASKRETGGHRKDGIFIAAGKNIKKGITVKGANIMDIFPTVLYLFNLPIPKDTDGVVLKDIFKETFLTENKISFQEDIDSKNEKVEGVYNRKQQEEIEKTLRGLGYI